MEQENPVGNYTISNKNYRFQILSSVIKYEGLVIGIAGSVFQEEFPMRVASIACGATIFTLGESFRKSAEEIAQREKFRELERRLTQNQQASQRPS